MGVRGLRGIAKGLRKQSTDTERHLWKNLRNRQIEDFKFRRQQPVGRYVVDFVNFERKVVIELDGSTHLMQAIQYVMNGFGPRGIRCCDSGITRYSAT